MATGHQPPADRDFFETTLKFLGDAMELLAVPALVVLAVIVLSGVPQSPFWTSVAVIGPFAAALLLAVLRSKY